MKPKVMVMAGLLAVTGGSVAAAPMQSNPSHSGTTTMGASHQGASTMGTSHTGKSTMGATTMGANRMGVTQSMQGLSALDKQYLKETAQSNLAELKLYPVVEKRAGSAQTKQFAQAMVRDHTRAQNDLKTVAAQLKYTLPKDVSPEEKAITTRLSKYQGAKFDAAYKQEMVRDHTMDIAQTQREISLGRNPQVKAIAQRMLPILQSHLRMANTLPGGRAPRTASR